MATPLHGRIDSAIRTAKQWESDKSLLTEIRNSIPMQLLVPELVLREVEWRSFLNIGDGAATADAACTASSFTKSPYYRDDDINYEGDDLLLKRLTLYFKQEVMKWCNQPPCSNETCTGNDDGKKMQTTGIPRGPITHEEKTGGASRVEVYNCTLCNTETTFPRYNSPRTLFHTKRGRCGEFANLFGEMICDEFMKPVANFTRLLIFTAICHFVPSQSHLDLLELKEHTAVPLDLTHDTY